MLVAGLMSAGLAGVASAQTRPTPAEFPPPDYRGQQYVDSKGCLFLRAGTAGATECFPRVTRKGVPLCGNPPSGNRVPIAGEAGGAVEAAPDTPTVKDVAPAEVEAPKVTLDQGHFVAIGSFGVAENVEKAMTRLRALNYPVARGSLSGNGGLVTVFAGPFDSAEAATRAAGELRGAGFPDAIALAP